MAVHEICLFLFEICLCLFFKFSVMTLNEVFYSELCALHLLVRLLQYNTESPFWCMRTVSSSCTELSSARPLMTLNVTSGNLSVSSRF